MPNRAFVPAPLVEAQPRVYRSFRGRQLKGLLFGACGAVVSLVVLGASDFMGYAVAFLAALPGFAYGYYHPQGKPVEYWLQVLYRYYTAPQLITANRAALRPAWKVRAAQIKPVLNALALMLRLRLTRRKELRTDG